MKKFLGPLITVVVVYLLSVGIIWLLSLIGPVSATLEGTIHAGAATIWFAAVGLLAAFFLIAALAFVFIFLILRLLEDKIPGAAGAIESIANLSSFLNPFS